MKAADNVDASVALYRSAVRAKAIEPLAVSKMVQLERVMVDGANLDIVNADALIDEIRQRRPDLFAPKVAPVKPSPPAEPPKIDASKMTKEQFDEEWSRRFPRVIDRAAGGVL